MCGIAGFINFKNNSELARRANEIQKHRGPDSQDVWSNNFLALAHQRLSIIDLNSRSDQPLMKENFVIIYNGEVYNYLELKNEYLSDIDFITDSETIKPILALAVVLEYLFVAIVCAAVLIKNPS